MASCPRCGAMNVDGATTCVACASPLTPMAVGAPAATSMGAPVMPKQRPTGVTILAVLYYIGAALLVLVALGLMMGGAALATMMAPAMGIPAGMFAAMAVVFGVFAILIAGLSGLTGWGMWNGKSWAWVLALVLTALNALSSIGSLLQGEYSSLLGLAIAGFIIWYLMQPGVKAWFGRT